MILKLLKALALKFLTIYKQALLSIIAKELYDPILKIVGSLNGTDLINDARRDFAFKQIKETAIGAGKTIKDNAIHIAISLAIDVIKGKA